MSEDAPEHLGSLEPSEAGDLDLVDIYFTYNFAEAEMIKDILVDNEVDCFIRSLEPPQFPVNTGKHGQFRVHVRRGNAQKAKDLLSEAIEADALTDEGEFIEGES
jgi:hypothetical protein